MANNSEDRKFYPLKGTVYYARFFEADKEYGKYSVAVGNLSEQNVKALKTLGLNVKEDPKGVMGSYINFRSQYPFKVYDANDGTWDTNNWFGNGTKGTFTFYTQALTKPRKMVVARCTKVVITDYIPYTKSTEEGSVYPLQSTTDLDSVVSSKSSKAPAVDFEDA